MRTTAAPTFRPQGHAELTCLYCGHALGDVPVPRGRRPTNAELRAAYAATPDATRPAWDAHGTPRCPRCAARLFIELSDRRALPYVAERISPRHTPAETDEREDAYEREDVYVGAAETAD
jgi:DNA-directed RNA polymerase subunit RPC12/RpoP